MKRSEVKGVMVHLKVKDLAISGQFFRSIGMETVEGPVPGDLYLTDGTFMLSLSTSDDISVGVVYLCNDPQALAASYPGLSVLHPGKGSDRMSARDASGTCLTFLACPDFSQKPLKGSAIGLCGNFFELSLETDRFEETVSFWEKAGYQVIYGKPEEENWVTLSDEWIKVGVYRQGTVDHPFRTPALTYFEKDMKDRIKLVKELGVPISYELESPCKTGITDAVLESPAGYHMFLFTA